MKVIDSSAVVKYVCREEGWEKVQKHLATGCVTVDLTFKELSNALWKRVVRGEINTERALQIIETFGEGKLVRIYPQSKLMTKAFKISVEKQIPVYDSIFIALAEQLDAPLVTSDETQAMKAEEIGVTAFLL
ncbi:MAG: type II toxin-antitoxin system VapC family toxin [Candidatus Caldarchaeum sp.]|nr:type II toxin-antitoxin system VapC family toxin [Candidatus Caldarchaeum sp.]MDW7978546.1 type II toxin-antitoxin system VapC family toxin [Candidatus Caldarchaeum sp.]